ncbi:MAG: thymidine phosphorylase family protein [Gammaproteobacteria bacterium]|nr:thymidine phosphorylase family protein [Gammaproteobacteria bacterium]
MSVTPPPSKTNDTATLKLRRVAIDTYRENVAYLHRECELYRAEGFQALSKITVSANGTRIYAVLNIVDDVNIVQPDELGLSLQAFAQMNLAPGGLVRAAHAEPAPSMDAVRRKIGGERLSAQDFHDIARDIVSHRYSKMEMAAFLVASGQTGLDREEILDLTRAMTQSGKQLSWDETVVVDKHCIGGIPGNRTSMIVVPIVAAHGMLMPKTSSRAITSPAGTADTMEVLANVNLSPETMHDVARTQRAFLAWGGTAHLAPADDILISVERPLGIDYHGQLAASILSKKLAAGSTHLLIDIPVGPTAKVRHMNEALQLRKLFEFAGDRLGLHLEVIITDGSQPVGRGIGPVLEARDAMQVLHNDPVAPNDLRQKSLRLAGRLLEFDPDVRGGYGYAIARDILDSGRALEKMQAIIAAQGQQQTHFKLGTLSFEITAAGSGVVTAIDNFQLAKIARMAGAPMDKGAGVDVLKKLGEPINRGETLYRVYAEFPADYQFALKLAQQNNGYTLGVESEVTKSYMEF